MHTSFKRQAFTLVELLTVIAIIAVLMGLLFPAVNGVRDTARKTQATNDATQLVNAVKAYYTEYGKYPVAGAAGSDTSITSSNQDLIKTLMGKDDALNPRRIVFFEPPIAKETGRYGVEMTGGTPSSNFLDPWGQPYRVVIDTSYDNSVTALGDTVPTGAVAWSPGKDGKDGSSPTHADAKDNAMSWR